MVPYKQLSVTDVLQDCQTFFEDAKPQFLSLLEKHINLN